MSQSNTTCPLCNRPPGDRHPNFCPRSRAARATLDASLNRPPRLVWKKGVMVYKKPRTYFSGYDIAQMFNPGVPHVCHGRNPRAGGVPSGRAEETALFLQTMGLERKP